MIDASRFRRRPLPARLPTAESVVLLMLVAFAATVIGTRWFLAWTGFPKVGGGDLHIAHALWGGALLFVGALLPLIWFGRRVHLAAAVLTGMGMGLFIDEVGKFITTRNDYFYPAAAPIIYSTFLLAVLLFLWIRRPRPNDHGDGRRELASLLRGVADAAGARVSFAPDGGAGPSVSSATLAARSVKPLTATFDWVPKPCTGQARTRQGDRTVVVAPGPVLARRARTSRGDRPRALRRRIRIFRCPHFLRLDCRVRHPRVGRAAPRARGDSRRRGRHKRRSDACRRGRARHWAE